MHGKERAIHITAIPHIIRSFPSSWLACLLRFRLQSFPSSWLVCLLGCRIHMRELLLGRRLHRLGRIAAGASAPPAGTHKNKKNIPITTLPPHYYIDSEFRNTTQHNATQHNTTQHNTTQHNTTQRNTTQHNTTRSWICLSGLATLALPAEAGEYPNDAPALLAMYQEVQQKQDVQADKAKQKEENGELQGDQREEAIASFRERRRLSPSPPPPIPATTRHPRTQPPTHCAEQRCITMVQNNGAEQRCGTTVHNNRSFLMSSRHFGQIIFRSFPPQKHALGCQKVAERLP